jgi:hypothetical protein
MVRLSLFAPIIAGLAACANVHDTPLPMVQSSDPTWDPVPDHLDGGALPR